MRRLRIRVVADPGASVRLRPAAAAIFVLPAVAAALLPAGAHWRAAPAHRPRGGRGRGRELGVPRAAGVALGTPSRLDARERRRGRRPRDAASAAARRARAHAPRVRKLRAGPGRARPRGAGRRAHGRRDTGLRIRRGRGAAGHARDCAPRGRGRRRGARDRARSWSRAGGRAATAYGPRCTPARPDGFFGASASAPIGRRFHPWIVGDLPFGCRRN